MADIEKEVEILAKLLDIDCAVARKALVLCENDAALATDYIFQISTWPTLDESKKIEAPRGPKIIRRPPPHLPASYIPSHLLRPPPTSPPLYSMNFPGHPPRRQRHRWIRKGYHLRIRPHLSLMSTATLAFSRKIYSRYGSIERHKANSDEEAAFQLGYMAAKFHNWIDH